MTFGESIVIKLWAVDDPKVRIKLSLEIIHLLVWMQDAYAMLSVDSDSIVENHLASKKFVSETLWKPLVDIIENNWKTILNKFLYYFDHFLLY